MELSAWSYSNNYRGTLSWSYTHTKKLLSTTSLCEQNGTWHPAIRLEINLIKNANNIAWKLSYIWNQIPLPDLYTRVKLMLADLLYANCALFENQQPLKINNPWERKRGSHSIYTVRLLRKFTLRFARTKDPYATATSCISTPEYCVFCGDINNVHTHKIPLRRFLQVQPLAGRTQSTTVTVWANDISTRLRRANTFTAGLPAVCRSFGV